MRKTLITTIVLFGFFWSHAQLPDKLSAEDKVYGLSKFWQEVNYNFIYLNKIDRGKWDSAYRAMIKVVQKTPNDYEYYREMQRFCSLLKDGHTNIYFPKEIKLFNTMFGPYRLFIENIEGKAIIAKINASKQNEIPVGSEIISVNGKSTKEYIKENVEPYISASTDYILQDHGIANLLQGLEGDEYDIKIKKPSGEVSQLHLVHKTTTEKEVYPESAPAQLLELKWLNDNTAYLALNSFANPRIDSLFYQILPELYKAKSLVIDLRYNGGGNTWIGTSILKYLTNDNTLYGARQISRMHIPAYKAWGKDVGEKDTLNNEWARKAYLNYKDKDFYEFEYQPLKIRITSRRLVVPTVILTGHNTASAAEDFLIYADNQKHMIRIGENTFGSTGQPLSFDLPGGGTARICSKQDVFPDGREFVGYGIKPAIEVKRTLADFLQKRDAVIEKAIEYLSK